MHLEEGKGASERAGSLCTLSLGSSLTGPHHLLSLASAVSHWVPFILRVVLH